jgi:TolB-like protein/Flp pilus assembly protein TadD/predicted Ser/Thr protein kinase
MIGQTISHYRVLRMLGEGGMGVVYEAEDIRLGRHVALKFVVHKKLDRQETVERFEREARAASVLNHPNICTVHDVGEEGGHHFIAMELLEGESLEGLLTKGPLPVRRLVDLASQIAEGLVAAHTRGVVHRDIKPANVFVTSTGLVKIMDFGLAKILQSPAAESLTASETDLTQTSDLTTPGLAMGTVSFMSPEQVRGEEVDARSDLFSFGALLYDMAVGEPPFRGSTPAVKLAGILERHPVPPLEMNSSLPARLQDVILKALEKDREDRYQTARDMAVDLRRIARELDSGAVTSTSGVMPAMGGSPTPPVAAAPVPAERPWYWLVGIGLGAVLAGLAIWRSGSDDAKPAAAAPAAGRPEIRSLAVLPLGNLSQDPAQEYFADGMTDELISRLSRISALRVISRTSAMRYKNSKKSLPEIARELEVDAVVEGAVRREEDRVRINARLIDASENQMWSETYDRELKDVLSIQSDVASAIAREIRVKVAPEESTQLAIRGPVNPDAYQSYLKGRVSFSRFTPESLAAAEQYFNQAIAKDPKYALAYAGLADTYIQLAGRARPPRETMPKARASIERALELEPNLAEAYASLGQVKLFYEFDFEGAGAEYRRALEGNPGSTVVRQANALYLAARVRADEALAEAERVFALDPVSIGSGCMRSRLLYYARRYDLAIAEYERTVAADPTVSGFCTFAIFAFVEKERFAEAIEAANRASAASPNEMLPRAALAHAYGMMGDRAQAEKVVAEMTELRKGRFISHIDFALAHSGWDPQEALRWLEKAYEGREGLLVYAKVDTVWDDLRGEPRFRELVRKIGIPE